MICSCWLILQQQSSTKEKESIALVKEAAARADTKASQAKALQIEAETRALLESAARAEKSSRILHAEGQVRMRLLCIRSTQALANKIVAGATAEAQYVLNEARAKGSLQLSKSKAAGLQLLSHAYGSPEALFKFSALDHLEEITEHAAKALENVQFDKVVIWDSANASNYQSIIVNAFAERLRSQRNQSEFSHPSV